jgi:glycosyltransferase involved in cell wall biosynthesis
MKKVLFFSATDYDLTRDNDTLEKKMVNLSQGMRVFVFARGQGWGIKKYKAQWFLLPRYFGKFGMFIWAVFAWTKALNIVRDKKIDCIIAQSPALDGFLAAWLKIFTKKELIIEAHGDWINSLFFYYRIPFSFLVKKILVWMGRFSLARADKVRVISSATERLVKENSSHKRIYKFPTFTDIDIFKAETKITYEPIIMYAGWLYRLKGVQFLIQAFARLEKKYPQFKLIIVGDGPYRSNLEKLARELVIRNIEFTGWKPQAEVKDIMRRCTCFVLPSLSEGLGRVLIEAAMLSKPAVGSNVDGIPDIIKDGETGFLFRPTDISDLAVKLNKLLGDPALVRRLGGNARKFVEDKFSTEKYFQEYIKMVNE